MATSCIIFLAISMAVAASNIQGQQIEHLQINEAHYLELGQQNFALISPGLEPNGWKTASVNGNNMLVFAGQCQPMVKQFDSLEQQERSILMKAKVRMFHVDQKPTYQTNINHQMGDNNNNNNNNNNNWNNINIDPNSNVIINDMDFNSGNFKIGDIRGSNVVIGNRGTSNIFSANLNSNNINSNRIGLNTITNINSQNLNSNNNNLNNIANINSVNINSNNNNNNNNNLDTIRGNKQDFYGQPIYRSGWSSYPLFGGSASMSANHITHNISIATFSRMGAFITKYDDENLSVSRPDFPNNIARIFVHREAATFAFNDGQLVMIPMECLEPVGAELVERAKQEARTGAQPVSKHLGLWQQK